MPQPDHVWVIPYCERIANFLGLQAWTWSLKHRSRLERERGTRIENADAICDADWVYLTAVITVDSQTWVDEMAQPSTSGKMLLCHEFLHLAFKQMAHGMETIVNVYFPAGDTPSDKTTAFTLYSDHEEHVITRLSRQVYEALERDEELERLRTEVKRLGRLVRELRADVKLAP